MVQKPHPDENEVTIMRVRGTADAESQENGSPVKRMRAIDAPEQGIAQLITGLETESISSR